MVSSHLSLAVLILTVYVCVLYRKSIYRHAYLSQIRLLKGPRSKDILVAMSTAGSQILLINIISC